MMKRVCILFLGFVFGLLTGAEAQDVRYLLDEGVKLEKEMKDEEALVKYQEALKLAPRDPAALAKNSELNSILGSRQSDKKQKTIFFEEAKKFAEMALQVDSLHPEANYVMALALGRMTLISPAKDKIKFVPEIHRFAEAALQADPNHVLALHTLGKWHVEVATLNFAEKAGLKIMAGKMPAASLSDAIRLMEKARSLSPGFILNMLELAKAYKANGQSDKSIEILSRMVKLPPKTADDAGYKAEGKTLLATLQ